MPEQQVSERAQQFLKALVERYIRDGQPVGSRTLARETGLDLSPATVRNVMSDLEDLGLVSSPHTSAGRVPTVLGYRMFIDSLLTVETLARNEIDAIRRGLGDVPDEPTLVQSASRVLSGITQMAGVVMLPRHEREVFRQIEFLPLAPRRVLAILVTSEGEVHNRVVNTERELTPSQLTSAANVLNEMLQGQDMRSVRARLLEQLEHARQHVDEMTRAAVTIAGEVVEAAEPRDDVMIAGQTNLMEFDELSGLERLKALFDAFVEKREILHLLDRCIEAKGIQIFVGDESGYALLDDLSLVTASYGVDNQVVGVLGVIGPSRMDYQRVIPVVDVTARLLSAALSEQ